MAAEPYTSRYHGIMGTVVDLSLDAASEADARLAEVKVIDEVVRLQQVFDVHQRDSEICRWRRSETIAGPELLEVLELALMWMRRSGGVFNPAVGILKRMWFESEETQVVPSADALAHAATMICRAPYAGDGSIMSPAIAAVDLNAIAKGWIVDQAVAAALGQPGIDGVTFNGGGDIRHRSRRRMVVGIEDPGRPYDNVVPMTRIEVSDAAIATSGGARRYWRIDGHRFAQVLDPRTGRPADRVLSATAVASDAATADVVATILTVLDPEAGISFVDELDGVGALIVDRAGEHIANGVWEAAEV